MENLTHETESNERTSLFDLIKLVLTDERLSKGDKKDLRDELRKMNASGDERWTYRWAIWLLGGGILLCTCFIFYVHVLGGKTPETLFAIATPLAGGLVGLLAPSGNAGQKPTRNSTQAL